MSNKTRAERISSVVTRLIDGWPVYGAVFAFLWAYNELWIEDKIRKGIEAQTAKTEAVTELTTSVSNNTQAIQAQTNTLNRLDDNVTLLHSDVKDIYRFLAGEPPPTISEE